MNSIIQNQHIHQTHHQQIKIWTFNNPFMGDIVHADHWAICDTDFSMSSSLFSHRRPRSEPASAAIWNCSLALFTGSSRMFLDFLLAPPVEGLLLPSNLDIASGTWTPARMTAEIVRLTRKRKKKETSQAWHATKEQPTNGVPFRRSDPYAIAAPAWPCTEFYQNLVPDSFHVHDI